MGQHALVVVFALAGLGSGALAALALAALARRRSWSYLLVALAIGSLVVRTVLGIGMLGGFVSLPAHHVLEHVLDVVIVALLFAAVYFARGVEAPTPSEQYE